MGLANLFRHGLAENGYGTGWCSFRLRSEVPPSRLRRASLVLLDRDTMAVGCRIEAARYVEDSDGAITSLANLIDTDPTMVASTEQLRGSETLLFEFIRTQGVSAFVRAAYAYVLGRPADSAGEQRYSHLIRGNFLSPYELLRALAESGEYRTLTHQMSAPTTDAFPFAVRS